MSSALHRPDALRPGTLDEFVGQSKVVSHLRIVLGAARQRGEMPDHLLFAGPPGLGKTTLAGIIAAELELPLMTTSGPAIQNPADLIGVLSCPRPSVVFLDEIHRMPPHAEEVLYPAMEDGVLDLVVGKGATAQSIRLPLQPFVLVGATTQMGAVSAPLRDRFGYVARVNLYDDDELTRVVQRSAGLLNVDIDADAAFEIARRSRGTPRVANSLLRRARDWAQMHETAQIDVGAARDALDAFGIDDRGLDDMAREVLRAVCEKFRGGPVGVRTLAATVGEAEGTVSEVYEPHLMRSGFLVRTPRGRVATVAAFEHLDLPVPAGLELELAAAGDGAGDTPAQQTLV